jgi:hypothetical protein
MHKSTSINWLHLKPTAIFAALVLAAVGTIFVWILFFMPMKSNGHYAYNGYMAFAAIGFVFFYQAYITLQENKASHYKMGIVLTIVGLLATVAMTVHTPDYKFTIISAGSLYFLYTDFCLLYALWELKDYGNRLVAISLLAVNCFPLYMGYITYS